MVTTDKVQSLSIPFNVEGREFYNNTLEAALSDLQVAGFEPVFMPQLADARIAAPADSPLWGKWYSAPSVRVTGKSVAGNSVVVYAHIPNYFSVPENIANAKKAGLVNGAGFMSQDEFQRLLDLEDGTNVFVVDYGVLRSSESGEIKVKDALSHPQVVPFLGGKEKAEAYLNRHQQVYDSKTIGVWHSNDLDGAGDEPLGRVLFLGYGSGGGLIGGDDLGSDGRFVGVPKNAAEGGKAENMVPTLEQVLRASKDFVPKAVQNEFTARISRLYK